MSELSPTIDNQILLVVDGKYYLFPKLTRLIEETEYEYPFLVRYNIAMNASLKEELSFEEALEWLSDKRPSSMT